MAKTISMVPVPGRRKRLGPHGNRCTWCGAQLVDGIGVEGGRFLSNALVCQPCGKLGVRCVCTRL